MPTHTILAAGPRDLGSMGPVPCITIRSGRTGRVRTYRVYASGLWAFAGEGL